jgi:outer membrane protein OmpA-like peptidoglycan-associated protein
VVPAASAQRPPPDQTSAPQSQPAGQRREVRPIDELFGRGGPGHPEGLVLGGDCAAQGPEADREIAEQAQAVVPLKVGLTMVNLWNPTEQEEYECISQVTAVHREGIDLTMTCTKPGRRTTLRRICRADLAGAHMLHTGVGVATVIGESGEELPETVVGATEFSLSRREFAELKATGETRHHYVQIGSADRLSWEAVTTLRREGAGKASITVHGAPVDVPVIRASGETEIWAFGRRERGRVTAVVLDDERFPMLVDYVHTIGSNTTPRFRLHFPKVTYPGADPEGELLKRGRLIVHGIYFDFNSDRIRKESDPILKELGEALARHPEWTLSINGHTDNVGGDSYNLTLSQRRAAAVRRALVERHGIGAGRLTSGGFGAGSPIDTNDTPEGRARNRRVELVRVEDPPAEPVR